MYSCKRCGNSKQSKFSTIKIGTYCTECIEFGRIFIHEELEIKQWMTSSELFSDYLLPFELTKRQHECSEQLVSYIKEKQNVLIYACCGAGKTEIVFPLITYCLKNRLKVAMAIPRRDVVIELEKRIRQAYPQKLVTSVYGGHRDVIDGDIILCTTHQLYRYSNAFDVLILDEVDAFPYRGNRMLETLAKNSCKGNFVYLSATPDIYLKQRVEKKQIQQITLFKRPHGHPLCIPSVFIGFQWMLLVRLYFFLSTYEHKTVLLFVPTITSANRIYQLIKYIRTCCVFTSQTEKREELMEEIRKKTFQVVICTTVLERGITIPDVQVAVWNACHHVFDEATLIQILGRVGRSKEAYNGNGLLFCFQKSSSVNACNSSLQRMNAA